VSFVEYNLSDDICITVSSVRKFPGNALTADGKTAI
jgi:hypothetical protein